ncbi:MAG: hypothetical protein ACI3XP_05850 [Eubacteriales bacterium]
MPLEFMVYIRSVYCYILSIDINFSSGRLQNHICKIICNGSNLLLVILFPDIPLILNCLLNGFYDRKPISASCALVTPAGAEMDNLFSPSSDSPLTESAERDTLLSSRAVSATFATPEKWCWAGAAFLLLSDR